MPGAEDKEQDFGIVQPQVTATSDFYAALLAMAGHDLRQPLQIIVSANAMLGRRLAGRPDHEYVQRSIQASIDLLNYLDRLVEVLRLHERVHDIRREAVSLETVFERVEKEHGAEARERGLRLRVRQSRVVIMSDRMLLEGILRNLVRNALKFTPGGGKVLVGCRRQGTTRAIEVHDSGVGIPEDRLADIFKAFHKLDSASPDGLGLGLFIVRRAASSLGHKIHVRSKLGRGSCFTVLAEAAPASA